MPTTETLIWDCPECCSESTGCSGLPKTLYVSGAVSGTMTEVYAGAYWTFTAFSGGCPVFVTVTCDSGVLSATVAVYSVQGTVDIQSSDPVLVVGTLQGPLPAECQFLVGQTVTVSE